MPAWRAIRPQNGPQNGPFGRREAPGGTLLSEPVDDQDWMVLLLGMAGAEFEVLAPGPREHLAAPAALLARGVRAWR